MIVWVRQFDVLVVSYELPVVNFLRRKLWSIEDMDLSSITTGQKKLEREGSGGYGMIGLARLIAPNKRSCSSRIGSC